MIQINWHKTAPLANITIDSAIGQFFWKTIWQEKHPWTLTQQLHFWKCNPLKKNPKLIKCDTLRYNGIITNNSDFKRSLYPKVENNVKLSQVHGKSRRHENCTWFTKKSHEKMITVSLDEKTATSIHRITKLTLKYAKEKTWRNVRKTYKEISK